MRLVSSLIVLGLAAHAAEFHLAPDGDDTQDGSAAHPWATLDHARDAMRAAGSGPHTVILATGTWRLTQTFVLDQRDSGTTYRAAPGASVSLCGSVRIPGTAVRPVTDPEIAERLLPEVRSTVREVDLKALGITDYGRFGPRGFRRPYVPAPLELIVDGTPMTVARWPNPGLPGEPIGTVLDKGPVTRNGEKPTRGGSFTFASDRPLRWGKAQDIWISGLFENGYADNTVQIAAIDPLRKVITTVQPHMYGFASGEPWRRWVAANLLEEIDQPGEFAVDRASGMLYLLAPTGSPDLAQARIEATVLEEPLLAIEGATGVVFDGVTFENARGMGVYIERGADNRIANATLRNLGMVAVCIGKGVSADPDYQHQYTGTPISRALGSWHEHLYANTAFNREAGTNQRIVNCHIHDIGAGGISLGGGDRITLQAAGNVVEDCDIHDINRWDRTYKGAVNIDGVGNIVRHNRIHNAPGSGLYFHGNDHRIEYNEVFAVMMDGDDMGACYMGRDPSERGTVIRYNYWHDLAPQHNTYAIYLDDFGGDGTTIDGNVFYRAGHRAALFVNNSSDVLIEHNLFIDCTDPVRLNGKVPYRTELFVQRFAAVGWDSPVWKARYPGFTSYLEGTHPRDVVIRRNLTLIASDPRLVRDAAGRFSIKPGSDLGIADFPELPYGQMGRRDARP